MGGAPVEIDLIAVRRDGDGLLVPTLAEIDLIAAVD
jgi:hypothetical protein